DATVTGVQTCALPIYPLRHNVDLHDSAENVHENRFHVFVGDQDFERFGHLLFRRAATDVEKISRFATIEFDDVHRCHGEARAIDEARDVAVEPNLIQPVL